MSQILIITENKTQIMREYMDLELYAIAEILQTDWQGYFADIPFSADVTLRFRDSQQTINLGIVNFTNKHLETLPHSIKLRKNIANK